MKTEFLFPLYFFQNQSLSTILASFSVGLIDLRWGKSAEDVQAVLPDLAIFWTTNWATFYDVQAAVTLVLTLAPF